MSLVLTFEREYIKAVLATSLLPWLVKSTKSAQRPETYGRKGLTSYGAKVVRNGAHLLQEKYTKRRLGFITFTLPPLPHEELAAVASRWGYLLKTLLQALRRRLREKSLPESIVLVTELQPRRLRSADLGALHVHMVLVGRHHRKAWAYSPRDYRNIWLGLVGNIVGRTLDDFPCENVESVKRDAGNYLSKYMSKGSEDIREYAEINGWECVPRQWWSATMSIKKAIKERTVTGQMSSSLLDKIVHQYWKNGGEANTCGLKFARPITIPGTKYQDIVIGYFGRLRPETYQDIYEISRGFRQEVASRVV
jgi:hypothetical protein